MIHFCESMLFWHSCALRIMKAVIGVITIKKFFIPRYT